VEGGLGEGVPEVVEGEGEVECYSCGVKLGGRDGSSGAW
jgi:hypothetical protein